MSLAPASVRPVINITRKGPQGRPEKVARMVFPEAASPLDVAAALAHWPESQGFRCDLRQIGPQGFSLPLDRAAYLGMAA